jgi:DNA-binding MarR family transcriptional regulator
MLLAIRRIMRAVDLHSRYLMQEYSLSGPQLLLLQELAHLGEVSIGALARAVSLSQATVTGIIDRLESRGLVSRRRDDADRRRVMVGVTAEGTQLLLEAPPPLQEAFVREYSRLEEWEQNLLLSSLQRVVSLMEATGLDAVPVLVEGSITEPDELISGSETAPENQPAS